MSLIITCCVTHTGMAWGTPDITSASFDNAPSTNIATFWVLPVSQADSQLSNFGCYSHFTLQFLHLYVAILTDTCHMHAIEYIRT